MTSSNPSVGQHIRRREDASLVRGRARFTDDLSRPDTLYCSFLRSPHAHAIIESIDPSRALAIESVEQVVTHEDIRDSQAPGTVPIGIQLPGLFVPERPLLAADRVRYQGEPVAAVLARDRYAARDGVEAIEVNYEPLAAAVDPGESAGNETVRIHEDAEDNIGITWDIGDREATDRAFREADHVFSFEHTQQRLIPNAMEPRAALAELDPSDGQLTVHLSTQTPHGIRLYLSELLGLRENRIRVVAPEVGGGFGSKDNYYPEEGLVAWCALEYEGPVKWTATRTETYLSDAQGRAREIAAELACSSDGTIEGLRVDSRADLGAYISTHSPIISTAIFSGVLSGPYSIPAIDCHIDGVFTNTVPVDSYRGAGRPEACYLVERMVREAARELDMEPAELRRKNFIPPDEFPYETAAGVVYDSGDYEPTLDQALELLEYESWRSRQEQAREEGRYLGIGLGCFVESAGAGPSGLLGPDSLMPALSESGLIRFHPSGSVTAYCGTSDHGQGHQTTYAQILADRLGIPMDEIEVVEGDTDEIPYGTGSFASRSTSLGGAALVRCTEKILAKARRIASHQLEVSPEDLEFDDGQFSVRGAPERSLPLQQIARDAYKATNLPDDMELGLESAAVYDPENFTYPHGTHAAVVEVDPGSGEVEVLRYVAVDDCGRQINPMIVEGQIQGGVAQGIGQALYEIGSYDGEGNLVTGSLMDYSFPNAVQIPELVCGATETPSPHNPLGAKGCGEAGAIGAPPTVVNAILDALRPLEVEHVEMPVTSDSLWTRIQSART